MKLRLRQTSGSSAPGAQDSHVPSRHLVEGDTVVLNIPGTNWIRDAQGTVTRVEEDRVQVRIEGKFFICRPWQLRRVGHRRGEEQP